MGFSDKKMTSKERLYAVYNHQKLDRVPIWMMFPFAQENFAADVYNIESYMEVVKYVRKYTDYIERNSISDNILEDVLFNHPDIIRKHEVTETDDAKLVIDSYAYKDIKFEKIRRTNRNGQVSIKNILNDINDLDKIMELPFKVPEVDLSKYKHLEQNLGENGVSGIRLIDAISFMHSICSETDFVVWAFTDTDKVKDFIDIVQSRIEKLYSIFLENNIGYVYWVSGSEFLCPPFAPPSLFLKLVTEYDKRLVDLIRDYGKKSLLHCHGNIRDVLHEIKKINPDSLHPIEASPPNGDCTLTEAREVLGEKIILVGNIQYSELDNKDPEEIDQLVKNAIFDGGPENFILSPTCTPYENNINERIQRNYIQFIKSGIKHGRMIKS